MVLQHENSAVQGSGLSIAKQLTELMGGETGLTSEENKGSTFWFSVPLVNAS